MDLKFCKVPQKIYFWKLLNFNVRTYAAAKLLIDMEVSLYAVSGYFSSIAQVVLKILTSPQKYQIQYKSGHNKISTAMQSEATK